MNPPIDQKQEPTAVNDTLINHRIPSEQGETTYENTRSRHVRRNMAVVVSGIFITTLVEPFGLGALPLKFFLKNDLKLGPEAVAIFKAAALIPFYFKPLVGLASDTWRLRGMRHRAYLLCSLFFGTVCWLFLGLTSSTYALLMITTFLIGAAVMTTGTVLGALLVEEGQRTGTTGLYSVLRLLAMSAAAIVAGAAGGLLANHSIFLTGLSGAALCSFMFLISAVYVREKPSCVPKINTVRAAATNMKLVWRAPAVRSVCGIVTLILIAPGFNTPLFYIQTDHLHFTKAFVGTLTVLNGIFAVVGAILYFYLCRRLNLRKLLLWSLFVHAIATLLYIYYVSPGTAIVIESFGAAMNSMALLSALDLAARAAPEGFAATAYALFISIGNLTYSLSDVLGSWLYSHGHFAFWLLVLLNASTTILALPLIKRLPTHLLDRHDSPS